MQLTFKKIDHTSDTTGICIHSLFQKSYAVEAAILKHDDFPPLKRTLKDIMKSDNHFYGCYSGSEMVAVTELEMSVNHIHISSLTVDPGHFRKGIGEQLLNFIYENFKVDLLTVETGLENFPAVNLYKNFGFIRNKVWMTPAGIQKISFTLTRQDKTLDQYRLK